VRFSYGWRAWSVFGSILRTGGACVCCAEKKQVYQVSIQTGEKQVKVGMKTQFKYMSPEMLHFSEFLNVKK
jgi:hypothetical protein